MSKIMHITEAPLNGPSEYTVGDPIRSRDTTYRVTRVQRVHTDAPPFINFHIYAEETDETNTKSKIALGG